MSSAVRCHVGSIVTCGMIRCQIFVALASNIIRTAPTESGRQKSVLFTTPTSLNANSKLLPRGTSTSVMSLITKTAATNYRVHFLRNMCTCSTPVGLSRGSKLYVSNNCTPSNVAENTTAVVDGSCALTASRDLVITAGSALTVENVAFANNFSDVDRGTRATDNTLFVGYRARVRGYVFARGNCEDNAGGINNDTGRTVLGTKTVKTCGNNALAIDSYHFTNGLYRSAGMISGIKVGTGVLKITLNMRDVSRFIVGGYCFSSGRILACLPTISNNKTVAVQCITGVMVRSYIFASYCATANGNRVTCTPSAR